MAGTGASLAWPLVRSEPFRQAFGRFVRYARVLFQRADSALLEDCGRLKSLNNPLEKLL